MKLPIGTTRLPGPGDFLPPDGGDPMKEQEYVMEYIEENYDDLIANIAQPTSSTDELSCLLYDLFTTSDDVRLNDIAKDLNNKFYEYAREKMMSEKDEY